MPTVPQVNATGGGINPQLDVLAKRLVGRQPAPVQDPEGLTAEMVEGGLGIPTGPERRKVPIEQRAKQSVDLAEMLAATRGLPAKERAAIQMQLLADPRAWNRDEWLD